MEIGTKAPYVAGLSGRQFTAQREKLSTQRLGKIPARQLLKLCTTQWKVTPRFNPNPPEKSPREKRGTLQVFFGIFLKLINGAFRCL